MTEVLRLSETMITSSKRLGAFPTAMERLVVDAVDKGVCKRLRELIATGEVRIHPPLLRSMIRKPESVDVESVPEALLPFFRHYRFMLRREKSKGA
jgi:hypothetical protein